MNAHSYSITGGRSRLDGECAVGGPLPFGAFTSKPRQPVGDQSGDETLMTSGEVVCRAIDAGNRCASTSATGTYTSE